MSQSRAHSALEAATNVVVGCLAALLTQLILFPMLGLQVVLWQNLALSAVFSVVSFLRSFALRRLFARFA